jgi:LPPG:FO 2-phospho-L-lactate transferase
MKITALAGGVGGAKLAHGLSKLISSDDFTVIVNTGDDFEHFGLYISPDLDTVCYTLADRSNPLTGWGRRDETFHVLETIKELGGPDWFLLGDKDLALHMERTRRLNEGHSLTYVSLEIEKAMGIPQKILPMCDEKVSTMVNTIEYGEIPFQEYFVFHKFMPTVKDFRFQGIENAKPSKAVILALQKADVIIICPSNPFVSINPIISLDGIKKILRKKYVIAVSPIIGEKAVKGPLGKMLRELGYNVHPLSILEIYKDFLNCLYIDTADFAEKMNDKLSGIIIKAEKILLPDIVYRKKLAENIIKHIMEEINN